MSDTEPLHSRPRPRPGGPDLLVSQSPLYRTVVQQCETYTCVSVIVRFVPREDYPAVGLLPSRRCHKCVAAHFARLTPRDIPDRRTEWDS
jgi:hypothetical protein